MATKTLLSLATVSLLAFAAKADTPYTVETTNSWFSFAAATDSLTTDWSGATRTRDNNLIKVDTEAGSPALYTAPTTAPSATRYRVKGNMTVTLNAGVPANNVFGDDTPNAALVAVAGSPNKWYGWDGDSWVDLSTGITTAPVEGNQYNVAIEFFVESSQLKIKYIVGNESQTVTTSESALPELSKVGLAGYGSFGDFGALGFDSFEVTTTKTEQELKDAGLVVGDGQTVAQALNSNGENGLPQWQSLALGIDPSTTTKPYTAPVQTDSGKLGFTIGNYGTPSVSGDVKFDVIELSGPNETTGTTVSSDNTAGSTAEVTAPTGVKYYKIKIKFQ